MKPNKPAPKPATPKPAAAKPVPKPAPVKSAAPRPKPEAKDAADKAAPIKFDTRPLVLTRVPQVDEDGDGESGGSASLLAGPRNVKPYIARRGEQYMNKEQLEHFARILQNWKRDLMVEVDRTVLHMKDEAANFPDPNDRATQEEEFSLELRTRDRERKLIRKIDEALKRIEDGSKPGRWLPCPWKPRSGASAAKSSTATATTATGSTPGYVGRFAPTPSGELHLGSLYAAAASYLDARANRGRWLVRIEDLDRQREAVGAAQGILNTLEAFGFEWDGEIVRQHDRMEGYAAALQELQSRGLTFPCSCSRLQLEDSIRYPGTCRARPPVASVATATRLRVEPARIQFHDRIQGMFRQDVAAAVGDIILKRRDGVIGYILAVVVDDAAQGVTHVVRGADLLDNTPRQNYLQHLLGLPVPQYAHVPVLLESNGSKLSKSRRSLGADARSALPQMLNVFSRLGLMPPGALASAGLRDAWDWAIRAWDIRCVPKRPHIRLTD